MSPVRHLSRGDEWQLDIKICPSTEVWAGHICLGVDILNDETKEAQEMDAG